MPELMPDNTPASGAVFLSYAREDTDAAKRIAEALRGFGIEVWFDQNELHGGDAWDAKIRRQIRECALFVPIVSQQTEARAEGYFRREWKIAIDRTQDMGSSRAFIVPVVIDDTKETGADVPEEFMKVQWTRLSGGAPTPEFVALVKRLLEGPRKPTLKPDLPRPPTLPPQFKHAARKTEDGGQGTENGGQSGRRSAVPRWSIGAIVAVVVGVGTALLVTRKPETPAAPASNVAAPLNPSSLTPSRPPQADAKSIAVLPFANMSADKDNDFLADGIHEDVLTSLAKIRDLKVISRTSVLAYRDTGSRNLKKIAADLGVAVVLEGSVRRSGNKVRVTAQLIDARTDEHLWAENYDGDTSDVFALQAKLAQQIAAALKATLTPGERSLIERRPTQDAQAYELYQRAKLMKQQLGTNATRPDYEAAVALYQQALDRDPNLALAWGDLTFLHGVMYWFGQVDPTPERRARAAAALAEAQRLAPAAPETRMAQGTFAYLCENDWPKALSELRAAETGLPNDDQLQYLLAITHRRLGLLPEALVYLQRAVDLNPYDLRAATTLVETFFSMRRYTAIPALAPRLLSLFPGDAQTSRYLIDAQYALDGDRAAWLRQRAAQPPLPNDLLGLNKDYLTAMRAGDLMAAEQVLNDPRQGWLPTYGQIIALPVSSFRAELALLRGDQAAARKHATDAITALRAGHWSPRQEPAVRLALARARVCAGEEGAAVELLQAMETLVRREKFLSLTWSEAARTLAAAGHNDEALECLRRLMSGPSVDVPQELRHDPFFTKLKSDPRFEEILKSAKPL